MIPHGLANGFLSISMARFGLLFCAGGLDPVFQIWLAKITPEKHRGILFGWALTAKSIGWTLAPLASGAVASVFGLRSVYFVGAILFLLLIPLISFVVRQMGTRRGAARAENGRP